MRKIHYSFFIPMLLLFSSCYNGYSGEGFGGAFSDLEGEIDEELLELGEEFDWRHKGEIASLLIPEKGHFISRSYRPDKIRLRDIATGEQLWEWDEFKGTAHPPNENNSYVYENSLVFVHGRNYYNIDLSSGKTRWSKQVLENNGCEYYPEHLTGVKNLFFHTLNIPVEGNLNQDAIFVGEMNSPQAPVLAFAPDFQKEVAFDYNNSIGLISGLIAFENEKNEILLAISYSEPVEKSQYQSYVGLWNVSQHTWEYKDVPTMKSAALGKLKRIGDQLYSYTTIELFCFDIQNGNLLWYKEADAHGFGDLAYSETHFLYTKDYNEIELIDNLTGNVIWTNPNYYSSDLALSEKRISFINHGQLHIWNLQDQSILKLIDSPYKENQSGAPSFSHCLQVMMWEENDKLDRLIIKSGDYLFGMGYLNEKAK